MKEKIKVKIIEESLWDRLPQYVKDEINGIINSKPKEMVEVVRGEWIHKEGVCGVVFCSKCDFELRLNDTNYCPNCGADMRGETDEHTDSN